MFRSSLVAIISFLCLQTIAQENGLPANISTAGGKEILRHTWAASWIKHPAASQLEYGIFHFRKTFQLSSVPEEFIIYVSADNRYKLYVNGRYVTNGPARGDELHWNYETVNIAAYLKPGNNLIAAEVVNFGIDRPLAQHTYQTAFLLQPKDSLYAGLNTGNPGWKVIQNKAYKPLHISFQTVQGFYAAGPCDDVNGAAYPWNWNEPGYDDSKWVAAVRSNQAVGRGFIYGNGVHLVPRSIPLLEATRKRFAKVARTDVSANGLITGKELVIKKNSRIRILLDNGHLTIGYPALVLSKGKSSHIKVTYAESLRDQEGKKGNRDHIEGKQMIGYSDRYHPDGGSNRTYQPLWLRTFRYVQLDIETGNDDLVINNYDYLFTAYPFEEKASFRSNDTTLSRIWEVAWRTARLCASETYFDCPYYEQLQYVGDTRIQALISLYVSGDDRLMRNALQLFDDSRIPDGLTQSRYPSYLPQIIPTYSLMWVNMLHDYYMYRSDSAFLDRLTDGVGGVLNWFERKIDGTGMLGGLEWWNFSDYTPLFGIGMPDGVDDGNSALTSLQFVYALQRGAQLLAWQGKQALSQHYAQLAENVKAAVLKHSYDSSRGLIAETPAKKRFSSHTTYFAILTDAIPAQEQANALTKVMEDNTVIPPSVYFSFYLARCLQKTGMAHKYLAQLRPWKNMLNQGLTTFSEWETDPRSDCHAWSASPLVDFLSLVAGIQPAAPGFEKVLVEPSFGELTAISATCPHPKGAIVVELERNGESVTGSVTLPAGVDGLFRYKNFETPLKGGIKQIIKYEKTN